MYLMQDSGMTAPAPAFPCAYGDNIFGYLPKDLFSEEMNCADFKLALFLGLSGGDHKLSAAAMARRAGISASAARRGLRNLTASGYIRIADTDDGTVYQISDQFLSEKGTFGYLDFRMFKADFAPAAFKILTFIGNFETGWWGTVKSLAVRVELSSSCVTKNLRRMVNRGILRKTIRRTPEGLRNMYTVDRLSLLKVIRIADEKSGDGSCELNTCDPSQAKNTAVAQPEHNAYANCCPQPGSCREEINNPVLSDPDFSGEPEYVVSETNLLEEYKKRRINKSADERMAMLQEINMKLHRYVRECEAYIAEYMSYCASAADERQRRIYSDRIGNLNRTAEFYRKQIERCEIQANAVRGAEEERKKEQGDSMSVHVLPSFGSVVTVPDKQDISACTFTEQPVRHADPCPYSASSHDDMRPAYKEEKEEERSYNEISEVRTDNSDPYRALDGLYEKFEPACDCDTAAENTKNIDAVKTGAGAFFHMKSKFRKLSGKQIAAALMIDPSVTGCSQEMAEVMRKVQGVFDNSVINGYKYGKKPADIADIEACVRLFFGEPLRYLDAYNDDTFAEITKNVYNRFKDNNIPLPAVKDLPYAMKDCVTHELIAVSARYNSIRYDFAPDIIQKAREDLSRFSPFGEGGSSTDISRNDVYCCLAAFFSRVIHRGAMPNINNKAVCKNFEKKTDSIVSFYCSNGRNWCLGREHMRRCDLWWAVYHLVVSELRRNAEQKCNVNAFPA